MTAPVSPDPADPAGTDAVAANAATPAVLPDRRAFRVLFLIVLTDMIGFGIILPILPVYAKAFGASDWQVTLLLAVYSLCQLIASPVLGGFSDRLGRRPVLVFSQVGSAMASTTLALATALLLHSPWGLTVVFLSRMVDGFSAGNLSAAQAYVSDTVAPKDKSKYMGMLGAAFGIGFAVGPALGGLLGHFSAALAPAVAACFSLSAAVAATLYLPESLKAPILHKHNQLRRSLHLLRRPVLAQTNVVWFLSMYAFVTAESVFALFMQDDYGFGTLKIGLMFGLAGVIIIGVQGRAIGPLTRRFGEWNLAAAGPLVFAVAMLLFATSAAYPLVALLIAAAVFNATGRSLQTPSISALISHQAQGDEQGAAFGLFQSFGSLARVAGPALAGLMYGHRHALPYFVACGVALLAGVWTVALRVQARSPEETAAVVTA